tara:strand:+ start:546 stop:1172 length:627 start_codon:yes stop_codon:yes gene_type:complete
MHHALLYIDSPNSCKSCTKALQKELNVSSIDTRVYEQEKFPIADARTLVQNIQTTPLAGEKTLTVIAVEKVDIEAQNALLKIAEEPPKHAHIALIVPSIDMLLPTLISRFVLFGSNSGVDDTSSAKEFMSATTAARQKITEKIVKDKDNLAAKTLIRDLESFFAKSSEKEKYKDEIQDLMAFRQYIEQRGASMKFMLEHLALTLPQIK